MKRHSAVESDPRAGDIVARLRRAADVAAQKARTLRHPILAWATMRMSPLDPIEAFGRSRASHRVLWLRPDERFGLAGLGSAWAFSGGGQGRFEEAASAWGACVADAVGDDANTGAVAAGPLALGGFAFAADGSPRAAWNGYPGARLAVPALCICTAGDSCWVTLALMVGTDGHAEVDDAVAHLRSITNPPERADDITIDADGVAPVLEEVPTPDRWKATVERGAQAARDGLLRKVVLARALNVRGIRTGPAAALRALRADYPGCAVFAVARGDRCFLGATPERLLYIQAGRVSTAAVAGSAPRGSTPDEDRRYGEALLRSPKERLEHAVVVDVIREVISEACDEITPATSPTLLKVANIQHLVTPLAGRLRERLSVLELAGRLHPTPAVGGFPRDRALRWINDHEKLERGWYAGLVGWVDRQGDGEFAVAIRSALVHGNQALLFAGCGIVAESDPDQEYAESWLKFRPMLAGLRVEGAAGAPAAGRAGRSREGSP
ncbi:MAG: isochorismate synthase [bacterium]